MWSLFLIACAAPLAPSPGGTSGADTLVIGVPGDAKNMLYVVSQSSSDGAIIDHTNLSPFESAFDCSLTSKPSLAKEWSFSEDGTQLDVTLREDLKWADGVPVTATDIAFTYDLVADPKVASPRKSSVEYMLPEARPQVIDGTHLRWRFSRAYDRTTMLAHTNLPPVPAHKLKDADRGSLRGNPLNTTEPLANGPFRVAEWEKNSRLVLEPNPGFTGDTEDRPRLRRVVFKVLPEYATRLLELENGAIDVMESVLVADAEMLAAKHPEIQLHRRGWRSMDYVGWNSLDPEDLKARAAGLPAGEKVDPEQVKPHPIFGDRAVRRALARAIDVEQLIRAILTSRTTGEVYGRPSVGTITPALCGVHNDAIARLTHDAHAAREELSGLGWEDHDGDGILDKDGVPFRFTLLINSGNARREKAAILLQAQLRRVGIDARVDKIESNTFFERLRKKDYEAALAGWSAALFVDPSSMWGRDSEFNFTSYRNPRVAELIDQGLREPDPARAQVLWKELQEIIYEDQPYAFLYWMDEIVAVHGRFQDVSVDILSPYGKLWRWWVPPAQVKYRY